MKKRTCAFILATCMTVGVVPSPVSASDSTVLAGAELEAFLQDSAEGEADVFDDDWEFDDDTNMENDESIPMIPIDFDLVIEKEDEEDEDDESIPMIPIDPDLVIKKEEKYVDALMTPEEDLVTEEEAFADEVATIADGDWLTVDWAVGGQIQFDKVTGAITDADESLTCVTIPSYIDGVKVTSIGSYAFYDCSGLTSITLPDSVTSIGSYAFYNCKSITSITIPDSVTSIGASTFYNCSGLTSIAIPDGVTSIESHTFAYCGALTSIKIPDGVTSIKGAAFWYCSSLTSITIPDGVTSVGSSAFQSCRALTSITIPDGVTSIGASTFQNCRALTSITIPDSVTSIGVAAFNYCSALISITIPDGVTSIEDNAFQACSSLTSITIPDSVTSIGDSAFWSCKALTSIKIPDGVTSIGGYAFYYCNEIISITIPDGVTSIGNYAFGYCSALTSITIPGSVTSIGTYAFHDCSALTSITIPDSVISIEDSAFTACTSLKSITVDDGNIKYSSSTEGVLFNKEKTSLHTYPSGNQNTFYVIPDSVTSVGNYAFTSCSVLTSITIPDSVTSIGNYAFFGCVNIESVYYNGSQAEWDKVSIGSNNEYLLNATIYCNHSDDSDNDERIIGGDCGDQGDNVQWELDRDAGILVISGTGAMADYLLGTSPWNPYASDITAIRIEENVICIGEYAFYGCASIESVYYNGSQAEWDKVSIGSNNEYLLNATIYCNHLDDSDNDERIIGGDCGDQGDNVQWELDRDTGILVINGTGAMADYLHGTAPWYPYIDDITSVEIGENVTWIGENTFSDCQNLTKLKIQKSVTNIEDSAFSDCASLTKIYFDGTQDEWKIIAVGSNNSSLSHSTIYYNDSTVGGVCGAQGDNLKWLYNKNTTVLIISGDGEMANYSQSPWDTYRNAVTQVIIEEGVTSIGNNVFSWSSKLKEVNVPNGMTSIGSSAFEWCVKLETINIPDTIINIGSSAFYNCTRITEFTIPPGVTKINDSTFKCCTKLIEIIIPSSVTYIGSRVFQQCYALEKVVFNDGLEGMSTHVFLYCRNIETLYIPKSLKTIGWQSFDSTYCSIGNVYYVGCAFGNAVN